MMDSEEFGRSLIGAQYPEELWRRSSKGMSEGSRDWVIEGVHSTPERTTLISGDMMRCAIIKRDGCIDYRRYYNKPLGDGDDDYLHICDIDEEIDRLQRLKAAVPGGDEDGA